MRTITFVNKSTVVPLGEFTKGIAALQKQLWQHFYPNYGLWVNLRASSTIDNRIEQILILDDATMAGALGYHDLDALQQPIGFVFAKTAIAAGDSWTATASHELLEQAADPFIFLTAPGPYKGQPAVYAYEICDACENFEYAIDGVMVSDFVLPTWFEEAPPNRPVKFDFLAKLKAPFTLGAGGYIGYFTKIEEWQQWFAESTPAHQRTVETYSRRHRRVN